MILEPIDISGKNIAQLPVAYKKPVEGERFLTPVPRDKCSHWGPFEIDIKGGQCKCLKCSEVVAPMYVLERLAERSKTKCRSCGVMTPISHA